MKDQATSPPQTTAADAAAQLPGVVVEGELGEADRALIRGAEARLVATTLNGERLPSPDGEVRSSGLGLIPAALLGEVAVAKTLSADRDADSVGGTLELTTRRASAAGTRRLEAALGTTDSDGPSGGKPLAGGDLVWGRRALDGRLGLLGAFAGEDAERGVEASSARFDGVSQDRREQLGFQLEEQRMGAAVTVDFAPDGETSLELRALAAGARIHELRRRVKDDFEEGAIERELKDARRERQLVSLSATAAHPLGGSLLELSLGLNTATDREPERVDTSFVQDEVTFSPTGEPTNENGARFRLDKIGVEHNRTRERNLFAAFDLTIPFRVGATGSSLLKVGVKARDKSKRRDTDLRLFEPKEEILLLDWASPADGSSRRQPMIAPASARRLLAALGDSGALGLAEETADYRAAETTTAAYTQVELAFGRFTVLPGLRYEHTCSDYRGFELAASGDGEDSLRPLRGQRGYGLWLPMLHLSFAPSDALILHAAFTRGYARPNYFDLVPYRLIDRDDLELEEGNPDLEPTLSWNGDLRLDWLTTAGRRLALGVFYRELTDFTFVRRGETLRDGVPFDTTRPENGKRARLYGLELSGQWRSTATAGFRAGWGVELASTVTRSQAFLEDTESRSLSLPGQAEWSGRLAFTYQRGAWAGVLSASWLGPYRTELGLERQEDLARDDQRRLDLAVSFAFKATMRLRLEGRNLSDQPLRMFAGSADRRTLTESYGRSVRLAFVLDR